MLADKLRSATAADKLFVDDLFQVWLSTGNGTSRTATGPDMTKGGLVITKARSATTSWRWVDTVRGAGVSLDSAATTGNTTESTGLTAFTSTGASFGADANYNANTVTFVDYLIRRAPKFFDVVTISHTNGTATNIALADLGTVGMVTAKITGTTGDWITWHRSLTAGNNLWLNTTAAQTTANAWLSVSGTTATLSASAPTGTYVIYAWAHDTSADGIIQCGSFTTDASGNATVNLGWEIQYATLKVSSTTGNWITVDSMRGMPVGSNDAQLYPNLANAETSGATLSPTAVGFDATGLAASQTYIYLAIRRPNKPPTSGAEVYNAIARTGTGAVLTTADFGFPVDAFYTQSRIGNVHTELFDRLRGGGVRGLQTSTANAEGNRPSSVQFNAGQQTIYIDNTTDINEGNPYTYIDYAFRRAPGFHDQICYTGTGANKTEAHNLGVQPQLWLIKSRSGATGWTIGSTLLNNTEKIVMPSPNGRVTDATAWNSTFPTATNISLGTQADVNASGGTYALWMWATLPGISSVFTYTGNGTSQTVNCGFSTGARFVMIIRVTASTAQDIFIWDTARGIVAGNDPRLSLDTTAAEVTTLDTIDTDSTGFIVNTDASNVNVNGAVYIGLAIA